jgi:hypothetical protein
MEERRDEYVCWWGILKERNHLVDLGVGGELN